MVYEAFEVAKAENYWHKLDSMLFLVPILWLDDDDGEKMQLQLYQS